MAGCVGIALGVVLGGVLNLFGLVHPLLLILIVICGLSAELFQQWRSRRSSDDIQTISNEQFQDKRLLAFVTAIIGIFLAVQVLGNLTPSYFSQPDDLDAYLTFPVEMLQLGSLPSDPFSERRVASGLGGNYFLQCFMMASGDVRTIRFIDWGFGTILFTGIIYALCRSFKLNRSYSLLIATLVFVIPMTRLNTSMMILPAAMFGCLFFILVERFPVQRFSWVSCLLQSLLIAGICPLKSTYLPAAFLVVGASSLVDVWQRRSAKTMLYGSLSIGLACLWLLPWSIDLKSKEGTYLFPIFGRGFEASAYGLIPLPNGAKHGLGVSQDILLAIAPLALPFFIAAFAVYLLPKSRTVLSVPNTIAVFLAVGMAVAVVGISTGGESVGRYSMAFQAPAIILFVALLARLSSDLPSRSYLIKGSLAFCSLWILALAFRYGIHYRDYFTYLADLNILHLDKEAYLDVAAEQRQTASLQAAVPPGAPLLEHLAVSCFQNFTRNRIFNADYPGMAGLPPGLPVDAGPERLRSYLLRVGIRYVAYTYRPDIFADLNPKVHLHELLHSQQHSGRHGWMTVQTKVSEDIQQSLNALSVDPLPVYDDGFSRVLDLARVAHKTSGPSAALSPDPISSAAFIR